MAAAAALFTTGCGGHHVMRALPGVAPTSTNRQSASSAADAIPDAVINNPIIAEARRFDGSVAPPRWMLAQGQTLQVNENPALFRILGTSGGGDGKTTFKLPNPKQAWIVAVAGTFPTSPSVLASLGRHMTHQDGLGEGARPVLVRVLSERKRVVRERRDAEILAGLRRARSSRSPRPSAPLRVPADLDRQFDAARADARSGSLATLSAGNQNRVQQLVAAVVNGTLSLNDATLNIAASLSLDEARSLLQVHDDEVRRFRSGWPGMDHPNPQFEAGRYVIEVAFTKDERKAASTMRQNG